MRSLKWFGAAVLAVAIAAPLAEAAPRGGAVSKARQPQRAAATIDNSGRMDVNNLDMVVTNHGSIAYDLITGNSGLIYPKGGTRTAVFAAGLWVGAKVGGDIRVAIGEYSQEFTPGPMANGTYQADVPEFRNYRIARGGVGYGDYLANAVPQGAPLDSLGNPLLLGDATIWSVFNDADPGVHSNMSTAPLGLEVQQTVFAFNRAGALGNIIFVKWKFINKGGNTLDSTYVSVWSDPDLGGFTDDLVGCDTTLSLGYCYNATNADGQYGSRPPAVGYDFFRGPIVWNGASYDTLGMTSFNKYINGTDPGTASEVYNYMSGLQANGTPIHVNDDPFQPITTYQVSGDPVTNTGWLDSNPADRRLFLSSGPFTMAPGDSQEVVTAIIIGQGSDRLSSISDLRSKDAVAQQVFDLNFDIPAPPPSPTVYFQPIDRGVRLVWGSEPVGDVQPNPSLGQEFHFEGFRIWQMSSNSADADPTVIATYDEANGVTTIFSDEFSSESGVIERTLKIAGSDHGLEYQLDLTQDAIQGGGLINNRDYYYAVTAYSYDVNNVTPYIVGGNQIGVVAEVLESARSTLRVQPRSSSAIFSVTSEPVSTGPTNLSGAVDVEQVTQADITGDLYSVTFDDQERWSLQNVTDATTLLTNQTVIDGSFNNPVVEGVMVRVTAPRGVAAIGELLADSTITDLTPNAANLDTTGTWYFSGSNLARFIPFYATFQHLTNHDYEIRIKAPADTTEYAWNYASGEVSFPASFRVPFEIWDLGFNTPADASDDVKICAMVRDVDLDGYWSWGDILYFRQIPYASVPWLTPGTKSTDFDPTGHDQSLGFFRFILDDNTYTEPTPPATTIRMYGERFTAADEYQFRTAPVGSAPGSVVGRDLKKVLAVPNPYYARSRYELTQFDRVMKFTNIPASRVVTLRIFNLGGDLVRTIRREATTPDEQAVATIEWNLNTERNLPVASGVYIYRLEVDGVGTKTDRIAVFIEQERLDNF
jgi:hypothetical protein